MSWNLVEKLEQLPSRFSKNIELGQQIATFSVFDKQDDGTYKYQTYTLKPAVLDYDSIVNAIISKEYPNDKMQAIINNYLLDPSNENTTKEFNDMQAFRKKAKDWAKDLLNYVKENNLWVFFD